ncbi:MAG: type IV pilus modification PilV family protein [Elusimicrobiota bacterium]
MNKKSKSSGFTLIEAMIAITILMITSIAGAYFLISSQQFVVDFEKQLQAGNLSMEELESFAWMDPADLDDINDGSYDFREDDVGSHLGWTKEYTIDDQGSYKKITVTLDMPEQ